jgi:hypothetical protein
LTPLGEDFMGHFAELITADDAEGNA